LDVRTTTLTPGLFPEDHFDAVASLQVFEHLEDPAAEIDRIAGVLRPGGILAIEVPSIASPLVRLMGGRYRHFNPDHFWFFSPETLQRFVQDHGFTVRHCYAPTRRLSIGWLSQGILSQYLPPRVGDAMVRAVKATPLANLVVGINVRDVVMVIAERDG
jgi:2-polyprenyl-3-methyl-5-hydroxy-6-metoxy-1,4-benzoquinol methylase